jgi:ATP-dependent RNA helicase DDX27
MESSGLRADDQTEEFFSSLQGGQKKRTRREQNLQQVTTATSIKEKSELTGKQLQDAVQWLDMGLAKSLVRAVSHAGFLAPTPVQAMSIPKALQRVDLCVRAVTGSGKTAAYMLPLIHHLITTSPYPKHGPHRRHPRSLILVPSRELAQQCDASAQQFSQFCEGLTRTVVMGGVSAQAQEAALANGPDLVIATPGRMCDVYTNFDLSAVSHRALQAATAMADGAAASPDLIAGGSIARSRLHYAQHSQTKSAPTVAKATTNRARDFLDLSRMEVVVFDEVDKLVAPEMLDQVKDIAERVINRRTPLNKAGRTLAPKDESVDPPQVCLFSATMTQAVDTFAELYLGNKSQNVDVGHVALASQLRQHFVRVASVDGLETVVSENHEAGTTSEASSLTRAKTAYLLGACTQHYRGPGVLVFAKFRTTVHRLVTLFNVLANKPEFEHLRATELQGTQSVDERTAALNAFKAGEVNFLFATDVASRGLDLSGVATVINYDLPAHLTAYIHRVGRTARIGAKGLAVSLVNEKADAEIMRAVVALSRSSNLSDTKVSTSEVRRRNIDASTIATAVSAINDVFPIVRELIAAEDAERQLAIAEAKLSKSFDDNMVPLTVRQQALAAQRRRLEALDQHAKSTASSENDPTRARRRRRWRRRLEKQEAELFAQTMGGGVEGRSHLSLEAPKKAWILSPKEQKERSRVVSEHYRRDSERATQEAAEQLSALDKEHHKLNLRDRAAKAKVKESAEKHKEKARAQRRELREKESKKVHAGVLKKVRRKKLATARREARKEKDTGPVKKRAKKSSKKYKRR